MKMNINTNMRRSITAFYRINKLLWSKWACVPAEHYSNQIKSNHFYYHITTAHMPWWVKFLRACSRQCRNNLHIDSILTYLYRRQCAEYIYSVHTVYYLRHTYTYQYTLCTVCTHFELEFKLKCSAWHIVKWECAVGCISFCCSLAW